MFVDLLSLEGLVGLVGLLGLVGLIMSLFRLVGLACYLSLFQGLDLKIFSNASMAFDDPK